MNTTTNTRGVSEAMVERMAAARWEVSRATPWDKVQPEVRQDEIAQMRAALDVVSSQSAPPAQPAERVPDGWKLAMWVLQSDLYRKLPEEERAVCDALVAENPYIAASPAPGGKGVDDKWCDCKRLRVLHLKGEFQGCHYFCKCDACGKPVIGGSYGFPDVLCEACNTAQQAAR